MCMAIVSRLGRDSEHTRHVRQEPEPLATFDTPLLTPVAAPGLDGATLGIGAGPLAVRAAAEVTPGPAVEVTAAAPPPQAPSLRTLSNMCMARASRLLNTDWQCGHTNWPEAERPPNPGRPPDATLEPPSSPQDAPLDVYGA